MVRLSLSFTECCLSCPWWFLRYQTRHPEETAKRPSRRATSPAARSGPCILRGSLRSHLRLTELHIQHAPISIQHGFLHHLRQRGMREYRVHQFFFRGLQVHGDHAALDQFGHFGADHVRAEQLPALVVEDYLDQALILAERNRLAVADEGETADEDLAAAF